MATDVLQFAPLGRPFTLGMLYDAHEDKLLPGVSLWDQGTLEEMTIQTFQYSSDFKIAASDSLDEKSSLLDVGGSVMVSLLSGMIEVEGSGRYMNDTKKSNHQARVSFQYKATTIFKQLMLPSLQLRNSLQLADVQSSATHIVSGILYGANAFFVFDSDKVQDESVQEIEGRMKAVVKKIPSFNIGGEVDIKLNAEEEKLTNLFTCKFYGDFILENNPTTFEDAVYAYATLPTLLGEDSAGVPLMVWLMPLKELETRASEAEFTRSAPIKGLNTEEDTVEPASTKAVIEISPGLRRKAQDVQEEFQSLQVRCSDSLEDKNYFPQITHRFSCFRKLCKLYMDTLQDIMATKVPAIRAGKEDETELRKIFADRENSPFGSQKLQEWMRSMETEVRVVRSCMQAMEGAKMVLSETELLMNLLNPEVEQALCFIFTSLETTDPSLDDMSKYLESGLESEATAIMPPSNRDLWFFSVDLVQKMRAQAIEFGDLARGLKSSSRYKLLVAAVPNDKYRGASIYHYIHSCLSTQDFCKPHISEVENIKDKKDLMFYATDLSLDPDTAHPKLLLSEDGKKVTQGAEVQDCPDLPQRFNHKVQVLCRQALSGRHYWELEWSVGFLDGVVVGVTYEGLFRKGDRDLCQLGFNDMSWCFGFQQLDQLYRFYSIHSSQSVFKKTSLSNVIRQLGVYLDWPAGTLSFYEVKGHKLRHLHTFRQTFSEPLYAGVELKGENNYVHFHLL